VIPFERPDALDLDATCSRKSCRRSSWRLLIFTFLLVLPPVMDYLENLLAKGVTWGTASEFLDPPAAGARAHDSDGGLVGS
jgi:hypothetical protein